VTVPVGSFKKGALTLGFTRGYMQSSAYVRHFGKDTPVVPRTKDLEFDTNTQAGTNNGQPVTFAQIYHWMGETAREQIFAVLNKVLNDHTLTLKVFAYDLSEPDVAKILLTLAKQGRVHVILDNAELHVTKRANPKRRKTSSKIYSTNRKRRRPSSSADRSRVFRTTRFSSS
jgi:hypothetical protein